MGRVALPHFKRRPVLDLSLSGTLSVNPFPDGVMNRFFSLQDNRELYCGKAGDGAKEPSSPFDLRVAHPSQRQAPLAMSPKSFLF